MKIPNVFNFIGAVWRIVKSAVSGRKLKVDKATELSRLAVCQQCPRLNLNHRQCLECSCFVDWKAPWATESCPKGLWRRELFRTAS